MKKNTAILVLALAILPLSACKTTSDQNADISKKSSDDVSERVENALEKAAIDAAERNGKSNFTATLLTLEKAYKRDSENPQNALLYARGLRQANMNDRAYAILSPFAKNKTPYPGVNTEMSMIALSLGNYDSAEKYAKTAVMQNPEDFQAYQNLGIALDAQKMHPEAERAFRKGLEHWQGNPTTIMNNLALNLATQGFVDEAIEVLERAKAISPERIEIERNLRIIRTLNER